LAGKGQEAHNSAVVINCAALLYLHREQLNGQADTLLLAAQHAAQVLASGAATKTLADLVRLSNSGAAA
jgi:anthranilate phosphoribosyltransferase